MISLSLIEIHASYQAIGYVVKDTPLLQKAGLGIGAVEHSLVLISIDAVPYLPGHKVRFLSGRDKLFKTNQLPLPIGGPQGFVLTSPVVAYDAVGRIQYILGGAVILLQLNDLCPGKCLLEAQNIPLYPPL